jgi:hypothetical protein
MTSTPSGVQVGRFVTCANQHLDLPLNDKPHRQIANFTIAFPGHHCHIPGVMFSVVRLRVKYRAALMGWLAMAHGG